MARVIGIDFGTTNSSVAYLEQGKPRVVLDKDRYKLVPSVVYFYEKSDNVRVMVGRAAKSKYIENPFCTIHSIKRFLGKSYEAEEVKIAQEKYYYILDRDPNAKSHEMDLIVRINEMDLSVTPVDIAAYIFRYLKQMTETFIKEPMENVVITMPNTQKTRYTSALKQVAEKVGINVLGMIDETTATAYAFGYLNKGEHTIAVYDIGGGTFDFAVLRRVPGGYEELASMGDPWLGGDDFDHAITQFLLREFKLSTRNKTFADGNTYKDGILITDKDVLRAIKTEAEKSKIALSETQQILIHVSNVMKEIAPDVHMDVKFSRDVLEYLESELIERSIGIALDTVENARTLDPNLKLDALLLVGGQSRMPKIKQRLREVFGDIIYDQILPEEGVAIGAAIYGHVLMAAKQKTGG
jgi:molecular chaperone DnaK